MAYTSDLPLSALSGEEKLFLERIRDLVTLCDQRGIPRFSAFLDERQQRIALSAGSLPGVTCGFWGGFPDAERKMFYALPDYCSPEDESLYPIRIITAEFPRQYALTHRDFLGALMGCGVKRETIGDIYVAEGRCDFLVTREVLRDAIWDSAGEYVSDNALNVYVKRLREKIKDHNGWKLATVWGIGYKFEVK